MYLLMLGLILHAIVENGGSGKRIRVAGGKKRKQPMRRANRVNTLGSNCNIAQIARIATIYATHSTQKNLKQNKCRLGW